MLKRLTPEQLDKVRDDLMNLGVVGSSLLAISPLEQDADSHGFIRDVFLAFLRSLFRAMPEDSYLWDADPAKSKIQIQYADPRNLAEKGVTPAITVELGPFTWGNHSINNFLGQEEDGTRVYTDLRNGSVIIRCRSSVKLEADSLAAVVAGAVHYMHADIERAAGFRWVEAYTANPSSGELQQLNKTGEAFVANVVCNVHYQETWKRPPTKFVQGPVIYVKEPKGVILD